jgi:glycosyltransferase involved in cell wall biosynthesis
MVNQDYEYFELIIADNASSDRTQEICRSFAMRDERIRYFRHPSNIGAGPNYNFVFHKSRGKYFKWAAHDDLCSPDLVFKCVNVLEINPSIVLCYPTIIEIDEKGGEIRVLSRNKANFSEAQKRFKDLVSWNYNCEEIYGIIRSKILKQSRLIRNYTDSDRTLLVQLGLFGKFYKVRNAKFFHRVHSGMSTKMHNDWRERAAWFNPELKNRSVLSGWKQLCEYIFIIFKGDLKLRDKYMCYLELMRFFKWRHKWLFQELFCTVKEIILEPYKKDPS